MVISTSVLRIRLSFCIFFPFLILYANRSSETEYLEGKGGVFSPITRLF